MTNYPMLDEKLAALRHAIEGGIKADSMQGLKLMELVDAIGEQFKRELANSRCLQNSPTAPAQRSYGCSITIRVGRHPSVSRSGSRSAWAHTIR